MRIALDVSAAFDPASGGGFYAARLAAALVETAPEHEFLLTAAAWSRDKWNSLPLPEARNAERFLMLAPQRLLLPAEHYAGLLWRERTLLGRGVDAYYSLGHDLPPLSRLPGVMTVHHVGGKLPEGWWPELYFGKMPAASAKRAARVITSSDYSRAELLKEWGLAPEKVVRVHAGGPDAEFRPLAAGDPEAPVKGPFLLHVGALNSRKNLPNLLQAFALLIDKKPSLPHKLVLAGRDADAAAEVRALAAKIPLAGRVFLAGAVSRADLLALYRRADALVYPSLLEGFGFPLLEAMACAVPVVAARAGSLTEVAGDAAILCDASRVDELALALERVVDPATAADLRRRGPARAAEFSWEKAAREALAVVASARKS